MDITVKLRSFAAFAAALGAAVAAEARDFTLVDIYDTSGVGTSYVCDLAFEAGEEGDSHVVYFAWNAEGDSGDTLGDWPNVLRIGSVDAGTRGRLSPSPPPPSPTSRPVQAPSPPVPFSPHPPGITTI